MRASNTPFSSPMPAAAIFKPRLPIAVFSKEVMGKRVNKRYVLDLINLGYAGNQPGVLEKTYFCDSSVLPLARSGIALGSAQAQCAWLHARPCADHLRPCV